MKLLTLFVFVLSVIASCCATDLSMDSEQHTISKTLHPVVGYLEHLSIFGLWGKVVKYLLTDDRAFAQHLIYADFEAKKIVNNDDKYREILDGLLKDYSSIIGILIRLPNVLYRVKDVRSKSTGKTFGEALVALLSLQRNPAATLKFVQSWKEYECTVDAKDDVHVPRIPATMKEQLFEDPDAMAKLLSDPIAMHEISSNLIRTINSVNFESSFNAVKHFVQMIKAVFPTLLQDVLQSSRSVTDSQTNSNLGDALETLLNIINRPNISRKLADIIETERAKVLTDPTKYGKLLQEMVAEAVHAPGDHLARTQKAADAATQTPQSKSIADNGSSSAPQLSNATGSGKSGKKLPNKTVSEADIDNIINSVLKKEPKSFLSDRSLRAAAASMPLSKLSSV